jgi:hypothetical protein
MTLHSGSMKLSVPTGNVATADSIHFLVRPHLAQLGIQCQGLTKTFSPNVYTFGIEVEGSSWEDIVQKLGVARADLLATYGLQVMSS